MLLVIYCHPAESFSGAAACYRALIAVHTNILVDLQVKRTVAKRVAPLNTFAAPVTEVLVYAVFVVRRLYELSVDRAGWTKPRQQYSR